MKPIYKLKPYKKYLLLVPLTFLALIIWQLGPSLPLAHHFPLREPQKRLALILTLFLMWAAKFLLWDQLSPSPHDNHLTQMLHTLRGRFLGALRFLKKTVIDKHGFSTPLNKLPWYLLIGPPGSGKTTLLTHSNINFILSKQKKQDDQEKTVSASSVCDWWVTRDLVLVDIPGCYTFSPAKDSLADVLNPDEENKTTSAKPHIHLVLWQNLLNLLIRYRQKNNIGAIVVALNLPELIKLSRQQQTQWFQDMKQRLVECWAKFGKLPIYFLITKCDLLPGFSEFFNDIGSDELMQPWGIPLSGRKEHEKLLDMFTDRFNALIKRLNKQLIWRLHQERNPQLRPLIKDFPLQLEFIKETVSHLIKTLTAANPGLELEGIYLCSAAQENISANSTTLFHHDVPSSLEMLQPSPFISRAYFIKHVISYLLPHTSHHIVQRFRQKKPRFSQLVYILGLALLFIGALGLGKDFQRGLYQVSTVQRYLAQYQLYLQQNSTQDSSITALSTALPLLNTLQVATQVPASTSRLKQIEAPYSTQSQHTAVSIYHKALQTIILPQIRNEFEKYLESADDKNPEQLYTALKAYLLLRRQDVEADRPQAHTNLTQVGFIIHTLEQISPSFSKKSANKELTQPAFIQHLQNALQLKQANILNNRLIKQTRKTLNSLPDTELAYILVKTMGNNNKESDLNFGTNIGTPPALISKGTMTQISFMFTAPAFPTVLKDNLPLAAVETINGNEVLGKKLYRMDSLVSNTEAIAALTQQLEKNYIGNYIDIWESLIDNISLNSPKNLTETDAMIMNLISTHSPLLQLLQTIHSNTDLEPILANSFKLQALNTLFNQTQTQQKESLYEIFTDLGELHQFLQAASTSGQKMKEQLPQQNRASATSQDPLSRIRAAAEKYPEPIKNWLQTLVASTQTNLHPENKLTPNQKVTIKEASLESLEAQNLVILPAPTAPAPMINKPASARKNTVLTQKNLPQRPTPLLPKLKTEPLKIADTATPAAVPSSPNKKEPKPAMKTKQAIETVTNEQTSKQPLQMGEYVRVLADNQHPMIFVQKD